MKANYAVEGVPQDKIASATSKSNRNRSNKSNLYIGHFTLDE